MNPCAATVDEQSLQDPMCIDWLLQNHQTLSLNQLPAAGKLPSSFPTTGTNAFEPENCLIFAPLTVNNGTIGVTPPPFRIDNNNNENNDHVLQNLDLKNQQMPVEHYKSELNQQNLKSSSIPTPTNSQPNAEESEPLDLSCSKVQKQRKASGDYFQSFTHIQEEEEEAHSPLNPPLIPALFGGEKVIPASVNKHFAGGYTCPVPFLVADHSSRLPDSDWTLSSSPPLSSSFSFHSNSAENNENGRYSNAPSYTVAHPLPAPPIVWVPFAIRNEAIQTETVFSSTGTSWEATTQTLKMVPVSPVFLQGHIDQPSSMDGKLPRENQIPPQFSPNFYSSIESPSPFSDSPRKHSTASSTSSSSFDFPMTSSSILIRRKLRVLLRNRN